MVAKLTQEYVDAWLAEHRPDFEPADYWFYTNNRTPIPGTCLVCNAKCVPTFGNMKDQDKSHCFKCTRALGVAAAAAHNRKRAEQSIRRVAAERGFQVVNIFMKAVSHGKRGMEKSTHATLRCSCGNQWDVQQSNLCSLGQGCGNCAEFGYNDSKPGAIYLLARNFDGVDQRGYGISNDWPTRIKGYERFGWLPLDVVEFENGQDARDFESVINRVVGETAGRSVEPDHVAYKNKEAFAEGYGVPMFRDVRSLVSWAVASAGSREEVLV